MKRNRMKERNLSNGMQVPVLGLGTWQITDRNTIMSLVPEAFGIGYRFFDLAAAYSNEISFGKAFAEAGIPREELLLSDKVWNTSRGYLEAQEACKKSLKKLKTDYLDLYLIHWPLREEEDPAWATVNAQTWRGLEKLYRDGWVRAIGVCNFSVSCLKELEKTAEIFPMVCQVECHPGWLPRELIGYCQEKGSLVEASSPLGTGKILTEPALIRLAEKYEKTPAQVSLRWLLSHGLAVIPKTVRSDRLAENMDVFDFDLSEEEMHILDGIVGESVFPDIL